MTHSSRESHGENSALLGFEAELWRIADQLWTNSGLSPSEYSIPVLALVFLEYVEHRFTVLVQKRHKRAKRPRRATPAVCRAAGVIYVPESARFSELLALPSDEGLGEAVDAAMRSIEVHNPELDGLLHHSFARFEPTILARLLQLFARIPRESSVDTFGRIYEYFLAKLAPRSLQKGGEYFTPESIVRLLVEIVEPFHGDILDPACGSGGMFIQSARFIAEQQQQHKRADASEISIHGIEKVGQTLALAKMNLAVHGLRGDIRQANAYYEDPHDCVGRFDFVMANPPFNQKAVDKQRIAEDRRRFPLGIPRADNANLLWVQLCYSALAKRGRAGLVLANSAASSQGSEAKLRAKFVEQGVIDVIVELSPNLFYTVTLPVTLWFLDKAKPSSARAGTILFIDAREVFQQVDRAHRELSPAQIEYLANIVRLYRGHAPLDRCGGGALLAAHFPDARYVDVPGLCRVVPLADVLARGSVLSPGRYVGYRVERIDDEGLTRDLAQLRAELETLDSAASELALEISAGLDALARESS